MKNKLIKIFSIITIIIVLATVLVVPTFASVNVALSEGLILRWDEDILNPYSTDTIKTYNFGFYDARGYYCSGMTLAYRSSDGFYIDYIYDDARAGGSQMVYNDGSGRDDAFFFAPAKIITLVSIPSDPEIVSFLQTYMTVSLGATFSEGYDAGYLAGISIGKSQGYQEGYDAGASASGTQNLGKNLLGDTLNAPMNALNMFVLYDPPGDIPPITLGTVLGGVISLTLFIAFLKIFAGG